MRKEKDHLGELELSDEVYYGVQTRRAMLNFPVSGTPITRSLVLAYVDLKAALALANMELGVLDKDIGQAIVWAAEEVLQGRHLDQFVVDIYQAGAGTSTNMNMNEVLANLALEKLGFRKGDYSKISPNDHVNMGQSTNDTFPTAAHLAIYRSSSRLQLALAGLEVELRAKSEEFEDVVKSGRTHLMDALPVTLGQEFGAYAAAVDRARERIRQRQQDLLELPLGGTATGTGVNAHPRLRETTLSILSQRDHQLYMPSKHGFEAMQSRALMLAYSSSLKELAIELIRIANDLRLLNSGPTTGFGEISLPAVQPGSSIMPGKVNPVMAECLDMICFQVIGHDTAIMLAGQAGQMEINVMTPLITHNILHTEELLINFLPVFTARCIADITADRERCRHYLDHNPILATFLDRKIGYLKAADVVDESLRSGKSIKVIAVEKGYLTKREADALFDPKAMVRPTYEEG